MTCINWVRVRRGARPARGSRLEIELEQWRRIAACQCDGELVDFAGHQEPLENPDRTEVAVFWRAGNHQLIAISELEVLRFRNWTVTCDSLNEKSWLHRPLMSAHLMKPKSPSRTWPLFVGLPGMRRMRQGT